MWWIINIVGLVGSWYYSSLESESILQNTICPILVAVFLIGIVVKIVLALGPAGGHGGDGGGGGFFSGFDGGDGGCGGGD